MRLTPDQIKQGILHPEQRVRDATAYYFADSFSPNPTIMPLVIQTIERHGWERFTANGDRPPKRTGAGGDRH